MLELSNEELLARLRSDEDHFTERKTFSDRNGWLKTAVAFANSAPIDWPAILFVGVTSSGQIEQPTPNLDQLQKTLTSELARAYPPLYNLPKIVTDENEKQCLAVLVPGSAERPHFSGKSYVRVGSQSAEASEEQFRELIAQRQSKVRELLKWKGWIVTLENIRNRGSHLGATRGRSALTLETCNQFYVTLVRIDGGRYSIPLNKLDISYDDDLGRLKIEVED